MRVLNHQTASLLEQAMIALKRVRVQFSILSLLLAISFCGGLACWVGRAERQRTAVARLRALDEFEVVFYSFDSEGPCADVVGRKYEPGWLAHAFGIDLFYNATNVFIDENQVDEAIPLLRCLPGLREIYVSPQRDDDSDEAARALKVQRAIYRLKRQFPRITVEEHPGCMILISRIPVVG